MELSEIDSLLNAFEWWQLALIFVTTILIAVVIVVLIIYLIIRFIDKRRVKFFDVLSLLFKRKPKAIESVAFARQQRHTIEENTDKNLNFPPPNAASEVDEPVKSPIPELLIEIEHNLKTVTEFTGGNLLPLKRDVWDAVRFSPHKFPLNLREQLVQVYTEIYVLNIIVKTSTQVGHKSSLFDEQYRKRITNIAEGLKRIKEDLE